MDELKDRNKALTMLALTKYITDGNDPKEFFALDDRGFSSQEQAHLIEFSTLAAKSFLERKAKVEAMRIDLPTARNQVDGLSVFLLANFPAAVEARKKDQGACEIAEKIIQDYQRKDHASRIITQGLMAVLEAKGEGKFRVCQTGLDSISDAGKYIRITRDEKGLLTFEVVTKKEVVEEQGEKGGEGNDADPQRESGKVSEKLEGDQGREA